MPETTQTLPGTTFSTSDGKKQPSIDSLLNCKIKVRSRGDTFKPDFQRTLPSSNVKPKAVSYADAIRFNLKTTTGNGDNIYTPDTGSKTFTPPIQSTSSAESTASNMSTISMQSLIAVTSVTTKTTVTYACTVGSGSAASSSSKTSHETCQCWRRFFESD